MTASRALRYAPHVGIISLGYVVFAYAAVPVALTTRLGIDFASFGLLTSAALGAFVAAQPLASRLTDHHPTARLLLWVTVLHAALAVVLDLVDSFLALLVLRALWGLAGGLVLSVGATQLARLHTGAQTTRQQGIYGGLLTVGGAAGFFVTPALADVAAATPGIGPVHAPGALLALPAIALCLVAPDGDRTRPPTGRTTTATDGTERPSVLRHPVVLLAAFAYVAIIGSFVTLSTFVTAYYTDLGVIGPLSVFVLLVASMGRWLGGLAVSNGWLTDATLIGGGTAGAALGFGALAVELPTVLTVVLPPLAMFAVSLPFGAVYAVAGRATARDGAGLAVVVAVGNVGSILLPAATGAIRDLTGVYGLGFLALAALNLAACVSIVRFRRRLVA